MFGQPTAFSGQCSARSDLRKDISVEFVTKTTVKFESNLRRRSPANVSWHRQITMISAKYTTGNTFRYFMGPSDIIWPSTLFCVRYRSFVIFSSFTQDSPAKLQGFEFYIRGSVHRNSSLKKSKEMHQYADIYLLLNYSTCFGSPRALNQEYIKL